MGDQLAKDLFGEARAGRPRRSWCAARRSWWWACSGRKEQDSSTAAATTPSWFIPWLDLPRHHRREVRRQLHLPGTEVRRSTPRGSPSDVRRVLAAALALRPRRQGGGRRSGTPPRCSCSSTPSCSVFRLFLGIIGVAHPHRRRHRRLEHHERRGRGADPGDRHQDGARRPQPDRPRQFLLETMLLTGVGGAVGLGHLGSDLRGLPAARRHGVRRRSRPLAVAWRC